MYGDDDIDHTAIITADNGSSSSDLLLTQHTPDKHQTSSVGDWFNNGYTVYGYEMDKANN